MPESTLIPKTPTTVGAWALLIAKTLESCNVDSHAVFAEAGLDLDTAKNPGARYLVHDMARVWELAVLKTGDPCFALRLPEFFQPSAYSALGLALASSRNINNALQRSIRYYQLTTDAAELSLQENDSFIELIFTIPPSHDTVAVEAIEAFTATIIGLFRTMTWEGFSPVAVEYKHGKDTGAEQYENFFGCAVTFNQSVTKVVFTKEQLAIELAFPNPSLAATLDEWMTQYLAQFRVDLVSTKVQSYLLNHITLGNTDQKSVAADLALSVRALQRKLKEEGTSFSKLFDNCRRQLAIKFISQKKIPLIEVTYMLGFSDQSNFSRAFRRWTDMTPHEYQEQRLSTRDDHAQPGR